MIGADVACSDGNYHLTVEIERAIKTKPIRTICAKCGFIFHQRGNWPDRRKEGTYGDPQMTERYKK